MKSRLKPKPSSNAKAKAQATVAEKRSQYLREKAAAEAAVMAEVRTRMRPIAAAEEQQLDSKEQAEARTADQVGEYAGLRVFGLGKHLVGGFGSGYVGDLACAYVRLQKSWLTGPVSTPTGNSGARKLNLLQEIPRRRRLNI